LADAYTPDAKLSAEEEDELIREAVACFKRARDHTSKWRQEAREDFAFVAGEQWSEQDRQTMADMNRPNLTFNRTGAIIKAICGQEANARHETTFQPRTVDDAGLAETINMVSRWALETCDAGYEEAESFRDCLICGVGVTDDRMDYEIDETGQFMRERVDPMESYWDPAARKKNLSDRRWDIHLTNVDTKLLEERYDLPPWNGKEMWEVDAEDESEPHDQDASNEYRSEGLPDKRYGQTRVGMYTYYRLEDVHLVDFPTGNPQSPFRTEKVEPKLWSRIKPRVEAMGWRSVRVRKRCYYRALLANGKVLMHEKSPCDGFTMKFMTGERDRNRGVFYGVVRDIKDPQRWANKFFSSMIDIVAANAKGGIMMEEGAVKDPRQIEQTWSSPRRVTMLTAGALANNRVQQKPMGQYPTSMDKLLAFAVSSIRDVSGVNVEMMGMADRDQPGIVEVQRKQSAMAILAPYFDALKSYRKEAGKVQLCFIRRYIPAETMARVVGQQYAKYVPMLKDEEALKFDVIVDEAPTSQNMKDQTWLVLGQMLPNLLEMGFPVPPEVLEYLPIPRSLAESWQRLLAKPDPMKQARQQLELQGMQADNAKGFSQAEANKARAQKAMQPDQSQMIKAQIDMAKGQQDMEIQRQKLELEKQKAVLDIELKFLEAQLDAQQQQQQHALDMRQQQDQHQVDLAHGEQEHQQQMAVNAQMGEAKIEMTKKQAAAKPKPNGASA
jgi:hypothetical protein